MGSIMTKAGLSNDVPGTMQGAFERAGLDKVSIQKVKLPAGRLLEKEEDIQNSLLPFKLSIPGLIKISASKFPSFDLVFSARPDTYMRFFFSSARYGN